jgi:glycerate kinase
MGDSTGNPRVVIAPDKFKGSLSAAEASAAIQRGVLAAAPSAVCSICPMADGGEGTVAAFVARGAQRRTVAVRGPLGATVNAAFALDGRTGVIEMAAASGLGLLEKAEYDPTRTDTFGTGQLIEAALDAGARRLILGIGGSATNDAGTGMLRALGVRFFDARGNRLEDGILAYDDLASIDVRGLDARLADTELAVAVDVDNPLCGPTGAAYTFAAQKGAGPSQIAALDRVIAHIADVAAQTLHHDARDVPGAGAAGGLGFALVAFLGAAMEPGVRLIARECGLDERLRGAALCLTGEGKIDAQTLHGKTVYGVGELARNAGVPVVAFGGAIESGIAAKLAERGIRVVPIAPDGTPVEVSIRDAARLLEAAATSVAAQALASPA